MKFLKKPSSMSAKDKAIQNTLKTILPHLGASKDVVFVSSLSKTMQFTEKQRAWALAMCFHTGHFLMENQKEAFVKRNVLSFVGKSLPSGKLLYESASTGALCLYKPPVPMMSVAGHFEVNGSKLLEFSSNKCYPHESTYSGNQYYTLPILMELLDFVTDPVQHVARSGICPVTGTKGRTPEREKFVSLYHEYLKKGLANG